MRWMKPSRCGVSLRCVPEVKRIQYIQFRAFLPATVAPSNQVTGGNHRTRTSATPFSAHHSCKVTRRISPFRRKSKGTGFGSDRALLMSCESWYRLHVTGIMNFCEGRGYCVSVEKSTGIEASPLDTDDISGCLKTRIIFWLAQERSR